MAQERIDLESFYEDHLSEYSTEELSALLSLTEERISIQDQLAPERKVALDALYRIALRLSAANRTIETGTSSNGANGQTLEFGHSEAQRASFQRKIFYQNRLKSVRQKYLENLIAEAVIISLIDEENSDSNNLLVSA